MLNTKPHFSEKKKIYKTLTKYKKAGTLDFKLENGVKKVFVFRPHVKKSLDR